MDFNFRRSSEYLFDLSLLHPVVSRLNECGIRFGQLKNGDLCKETAKSECILNDINSRISIFANLMINDDIVLRPLHRSDFTRGHTLVLAQLTGVGNVTQSMFEQRFDEMRGTGRNYVTVLEDVRSGRVIGSGTLMLEYSLPLAIQRARASHSDSAPDSDSHTAPAPSPLAVDSPKHQQLDNRDISNLKCAADTDAHVEHCARAPAFRGRIEDIVVDNAYRGQNLGLCVVRSLIELARELRVPCLSLECEARNASFYERLGFARPTGPSGDLSGLDPHASVLFSYIRFIH